MKTGFQHTKPVMPGQDRTSVTIESQCEVPRTLLISGKINDLG